MALAGGPARADQPTTPTSTFPLTKDDFQLRVGTMDGNTFVPMNPTQEKEYFNRPRCLCGTEMVAVEVRISDAGRAKLTQAEAELRLVAGSDCICNSSQASCVQPPGYGDDGRTATCEQIGPAYTLLDLSMRPIIFRPSVQQLFRAGTDATDPNKICNQRTDRLISLWVESTDGDMNPEINGLGLTATLDGQGPPAPTNLQVRPGNEALEVSWTGVPVTTDFAGYQVLCSRAGDIQVFKRDTFRPAFASAACETAPTNLLPIERLDTSFVCSNLIGAGTRHRITGLQNGIPYVVGVVAIDNTDNPSPIMELVQASPQETRDFYAGYRADGGAAEGGFCSVARGRGRGAGEAGYLGAAMALAGFALARRRRRTRAGAPR